jgi:hypothetical protein
MKLRNLVPKKAGHFLMAKPYIWSGFLLATIALWGIMHPRL